MSNTESTGEMVVETAGNFVDDVWGADKPPYPTDPAFTLNEELYTGLTWREKATAIAARVRELGATSHIISALDEVTWLL
jgi:Xaa-Pro aminopeptidase